MRCPRHPSMKCLPRRPYCTLCEDGSFAVEHDLRTLDYQQMAQHVTPGIQGIRTRRQYQRLLKRHGLTDDIPPKELMAMTVNRGKRERVREDSIQRLLDSITPSLFRSPRGVGTRLLHHHQRRG